jgi:hypothetical protein
MTPRVTRLSAVVVPLLLVLAAIGVAPTYAGGGQARALKDVQVSNRLKVVWQGYQKRPVYQKVADVPGIGQVELLCKPNNTMIRIRANDRSAETQMWMSKFETKEGTDRVAVKNVRIFKYATAADDGSGGTGWASHEGLNQQSPIEDYENGYAFGVFSQRPGRNQPGGGALTVPATSFKLTWYWERFAYPGSQYCKMTLALDTNTTQQFGLNWHGDDNAANNTTSSTYLPGFGTAEVRCETGADGAQTVSLRPDNTDAWMDYEVIRGEGLVSDRVDQYNPVPTDPVTGLLGPVELPTNGMMRIWWTVGGVTQGWVLSSYMVTNNVRHPELNVCEVAATPLP